MSLKLKTRILAAPSLFPNSKPRGPSDIRFSNRWGKANADLLSLLNQRCRRDQIRCCENAGGGGGGDHHHVLKKTGVWWDLNTCPLPAGFDPRWVRPCIESALEKQIGFRTAVTIYALGNLECISIDLLEKISSSGIILTHSPCVGKGLITFMDAWFDDNDFRNPQPPGYVMVISGDHKMLYPERFRRFGHTTFVAYPKGVRLLAPHAQLTLIGEEFDYVFAKQFVWETLLSDNLAEETLLYTCDEEPLCICYICNYGYEVCDEFITHLKSEEHKKKLFVIQSNILGEQEAISLNEAENKKRQEAASPWGLCVKEFTEGEFVLK
ncbi:hypothetical protein HA466_0131570 [Hirschfeldia incana]|nr:hypothetical protein HA466_0131570 [Hirschfeldia incana]